MKAATRAVIVLLVAGLTATATGRWWQRPCVNPFSLPVLGYDPRLAPNNGWCVAKMPGSPGVVCVFSSPQQAQGTRIPWCGRSTDDGYSWYERDFFPNAGPAWDPVVAVAGDTIIMAFAAEPTGYQQGIYTTWRKGESWRGVWHFSGESDFYPPDRGNHRAAYHPSVAILHDNDGAFGQVVFQDSTVDWLGSEESLGMWIMYREAEIANPSEDPEDWWGYKKQESAFEPYRTHPDFPSVAAAFDNSAQDNCWVAFQDSARGLRPTEWDIYFEDVSGNCGYDNREVTDNVNCDCKRPSAQWRQKTGCDDSVVVAYERWDQGECFIGLSCQSEQRCENDQYPWVPLRPFEEYEDQFASMSQPNLWSHNDTLFMVFIGDRDGRLGVYFSYSTNIVDWAAPVEASWGRGTRFDTPSIVAHGNRVFIACRQTDGPDLCWLLRLFWEEENIFIPRQAEHDGMGSSGSRVLGQTQLPGGALWRATVATDSAWFVRADRSTDGGETWEDMGAPDYGTYPALAMDEDSSPCITFVRDDTLYCSWWMAESLRWTAPVTVFEGSSTQAPARTSVALYPDKSAGVKVAAITFPVYDLATQSSMVLFAKVDTGRVVLDTIAVSSGLGDSFPCTTSTGRTRCT